MGSLITERALAASPPSVLIIRIFGGIIEAYVSQLYNIMIQYTSILWLHRLSMT